MRRAAFAHDVTPILRGWSGGDAQALNRLAPLVYHKLHRAARGYMAGKRAGHALQATALAIEIYLRLAGAQRVSRHRRARASAKRGAGQAAGKPANLLELDVPLNHPAKRGPRKGQVVELRFFDGFSEMEMAAALVESEEMVRRDWRLARV